jgi:molybdopterin-guanine dinucleotide biosynthesis protein A
MTALGYDRAAVTGVILAGGRGQRMSGRDKGLVELDGRALVEHALERLQGQVGPMLISANRHRERYAQLGPAVVTDALEGFQGPLAGIAAALRVCRTAYLLAVPCDAPFLPADLGPRLWAALHGSAFDLAVPYDGQRSQHLFLLMRNAVLTGLTRYLASGGRAVIGWLERETAAIVPFDDCPQAFRNINSEADLAAVSAAGQDRASR